MAFAALSPLAAQAIPGLFNVLGGFAETGRLDEAFDTIQEGSRFQPRGFSGLGGTLGFNANGVGSFMQNPMDALLRQQFGASALQGLQGGGLLTNALNADPNISGAFSDIQGQLQNPFSFQSGVSGAPQQFLQTGTQTFNNLTGRGNALFDQANELFGRDNLDARFGQELGRLRQAAQPFEDRATAQLGTSLFGTGRRGTTGGIDDANLFAESLFNSDLARQGQALGTAIQEREADRGLAATLLGQGQGLFGTALGGLQGLGQTAGALDQQLFQQGLAGQQQNLSQGQQRLLNAQNLFGLRSSAISGDRDIAPGLFSQVLGQQQAANNLFLGSLNAEAQRMLGFGNIAGALGQAGANSGAARGGLFSGIGSAIGGLFG